jgi:hypothetical protein
MTVLFLLVVAAISCQAIIVTYDQHTTSTLALRSIMKP